jgi:hypothetical protein
MSVNSEGPKPPKGRVRQFLGFAALIGACVVALTAVQLLSPKGRSHSELLLDRLLTAGSEPTPFSTVMPDPGWDTVCRLNPYDRPSRRLPEMLEEDLTDFTFEPYDKIIAEGENGLAFIDHQKKTALIYGLKKYEVYELNNKKEWGRAIYEITGQPCLRRELASFAIERVQAPNLSYDQLVLISAK